MHPSVAVVTVAHVMVVLLPLADVGVASKGVVWSTPRYATLMPVVWSPVSATVVAESAPSAIL